MSEKFGRNYRLSVGTPDGGHIIIRLPFTIEFDITKNTLTSANVCQLRIYNLSEINRNQMRFNNSNYGEYRPVELQAGYGTNIGTIFKGNITQAWSARQGVNFITQIESFDGGFAFANSDVSLTFPSGTPQKEVLTGLVQQLPNVSQGVIGKYPGTLGRGNSYNGSATSLLTQLSGGGFFIDNEKANILGNNEYIDESNSYLTINSESGLLGTPILEQTIVRFDMIFEPALNIGRKILLNSSTASNFNGFYKVVAAKHRGMISAAVCGNAVTTGEFFYSKLLEGVSL